MASRNHLTRGGGLGCDILEKPAAIDGLTMGCLVELTQMAVIGTGLDLGAECDNVKGGILVPLAVYAHERLKTANDICPVKRLVVRRNGVILASCIEGAQRLGQQRILIVERGQVQLVLELGVWGLHDEARLAPCLDVVETTFCYVPGKLGGFGRKKSRYLLSSHFAVGWGFAWQRRPATNAAVQMQNAATRNDLYQYVDKVSIGQNQGEKRVEKRTAKMVHRYKCGWGKGEKKTSLTKEAEKTTTFIDPTEDWQTGDLSPTVRVTQRCGEHYYEAGGGYGVDG